MLTRTLKIERVYPLGDYKNIKFMDEFTDIPEHIATNPELINKLFVMLMMQCDLNYFQYASIWKENNQFKDLEGAITKLNDLIETTMNEMKIKFKNGHTVEDGQS